MRVYLSQLFGLNIYLVHNVLRMEVQSTQFVDDHIKHRINLIVILFHFLQSIFLEIVKLSILSIVTLLFLTFLL